MVSRGMVEASVMVLQQPINNNKEDAVLDNSHSSSESSAWTPLFTSTPKSLTMACQRTSLLDDASSSPSLWDCKTPRLIDVVFSMPDAAVYGAGNLRVNIYYSFNYFIDKQLKNLLSDIGQF